MQDQPQSVLTKLLQRVQEDRGFAGLSGSVLTVNTAADDDAGIRELTGAILRDAGLTGRLLRLANASARGARNVSTVDQAITVLGLNTVRATAPGLALFETMANQPQARQMYAEIVAALFCGMLAGRITRANGARYSAQESQVCGLLQNLGRMMAVYYLYDDIESSRKLQAEKNLAEDDAVAQTLGLTYDEMSLAIANAWQLPDVIVNSLSAETEKGPPRAASTALGWQQLCARFAGRVTDALFRQPEARERIELGQLIQHYRTALGLRDDEVHEWIAQVLADTGAALEQAAFPMTVADARGLLRKASEKVLDLLSSQDSLTQGKSFERKPIEIIHQTLRQLHDEFAFDLTMLLLPNGGSALSGVSGVGRNASVITSKFRCHGPKPDIFRLLMAKQADTWVGDVQSPTFAKLMPDWYAGTVGARSFLALSLVHEGAFLGMLYGDYMVQRAEAPAEKTAGSIKKYKAQVVGALQKR